MAFMFTVTCALAPPAQAQHDRMMPTPIPAQPSVEIGTGPLRGATALPVSVTGPSYTQGNITLPAISASAARTTDGRLVVALVNADANRAHRVSLPRAGAARGAGG